jgi:hypothetical protein
MADPQDRPDNPPDTAPQDAPGAGPVPPAPAEPTAEKSPEHPPPPAMAPHTAAKKTPAKKAPAKAAKKVQQAFPKAPKKGQHAEPRKTPAGKAAAKKAPAKKAPGKKAPPKKTEPAANSKSQPRTAPRIGTNGQFATAAQDAAAHAKSTVDKASNPVSREAALPSGGRSRVPMLVAIAVSLLALVLVRQLRRRDS